MDVMPAKNLRVDGHYWLDSRALGSLGHLGSGTKPPDGEYANGQTVCGRAVSGLPMTTLEERRACASCVDVITRAKEQRDAERFKKPVRR